MREKKAPTANHHLLNTELHSHRRVSAPTVQAKEEVSTSESLFERRPGNGRYPTNTFTHTTVVQTKLVVNEPGDAYEQEADRVADSVMRMPAVSAEQALAPVPEVNLIQAKLARQANIRRAATAVTPEISESTESRIAQMRSGGSPLPKQEREFFEQRMGADFGGVRVHTDSNAIQTSRDLNARAFTVGNTIAFNSGEYQPGTEDGKRLLAHELTHTLQQGAVQRAPIQRVMVQRQTGTCPVCGKKGPVGEKCPDCGETFAPEIETHDMAQHAAVQSVAPETVGPETVGPETVGKIKETATAVSLPKIEKPTPTPGPAERPPATPQKPVLAEKAPAPATVKQVEPQALPVLPQTEALPKQPTPLENEAKVVPVATAVPEPAAQVAQNEPAVEPVLPATAAETATEAPSPTLPEKQATPPVEAVDSSEPLVPEGEMDLKSALLAGLQKAKERTAVWEQPLTVKAEAAPPVAGMVEKIVGGLKATPTATTAPESAPTAAPTLTNAPVQATKLAIEQPEVAGSTAVPEPVAASQAETTPTVPTLTAVGKEPAEVAPDGLMPLKGTAVKEPEEKPTVVVAESKPAPTAKPDEKPGLIQREEKEGEEGGLFDEMLARAKGILMSLQSTAEGNKSDLAADASGKQGELSANATAKGEQVTQEGETENTALNMEGQAESGKLTTDSQTKGQEVTMERETKGSELQTEGQTKGQTLLAMGQAIGQGVVNEALIQGTNLLLGFMTKERSVQIEGQNQTQDLQTKAETKAKGLNQDYQKLESEGNIHNALVAEMSIQGAVALANKAVAMGGKIQNDTTQLQTTADTEIQSVDLRAKIITDVTQSAVAGLINGFKPKENCCGHLEESYGLRDMVNSLKKKGSDVFDAVLAPIPSKIQNLKQRSQQVSETAHAKWNTLRQETGKLVNKTSNKINEGKRILHDGWSSFANTSKQTIAGWRKSLTGSYQSVLGMIGTATREGNVKSVQATQSVNAFSNIAHELLGTQKNFKLQEIINKVKEDSAAMAAKSNKVKDLMHIKGEQCKAGMNQKATKAHWLIQQKVATTNTTFDIFGKSLIQAIEGKGTDFVTNTQSTGGSIMKWFGSDVNRIVSGVAEGKSASTTAVSNSAASNATLLTQKGLGATTGVQQTGTQNQTIVGQAFSLAENSLANACMVANQSVVQKGSQSKTTVQTAGQSAGFHVTKAGNIATNHLGQAAQKANANLKAMCSDTTTNLNTAGNQSEAQLQQSQLMHQGNWNVFQNFTVNQFNGYMNQTQNLQPKFGASVFQPLLMWTKQEPLRIQNQINDQLVPSLIGRQNTLSKSFQEVMKKIDGEIALAKKTQSTPANQSDKNPDCSKMHSGGKTSIEEIEGEINAKKEEWKDTGKDAKRDTAVYGPETVIPTILNPNNIATINQMAAKYEIPPELLATIIAAEMDFDHGGDDYMQDGMARRGDLPEKLQDGVGIASVHMKSLEQAIDHINEKFPDSDLAKNASSYDKSPENRASFPGSVEGAAIVIKSLVIYKDNKVDTPEDIAVIFGAYRNGLKGKSGDGEGYTEESFKNNTANGSKNITGPCKIGGDAHMVLPYANLFSSAPLKDLKVL